MSNNGGAAGGNGGSSSTPNRPLAAESPRRRSVTPGRGRGSPQPITELALSTPPRPPAGSSSGGASGSGGAGSFGLSFQGGQAVPVGGRGSGGGGAARVGGSPLGRKRPRDSSAAAADGGNQPEEGGGNFMCSVCHKGFPTARAMFGHLRAHPDRGWTGARPPPAFRAEEEFADLRAMQPAATDAQAAAQGGVGEEEVNYRVPDLNNPPPPDSE